MNTPSMLHLCNTIVVFSTLLVGHFILHNSILNTLILLFTFAIVYLLARLEGYYDR